MRSLKRLLRRREEPIKEELSATVATRKALPTEERFRRKDRALLEKFYYFEPLLFEGINFFAEQVVGQGYEIVSKDPEAKSLVEDFCRTNNLLWLLQRVQLDLGKFGNSFLERLYDQQNKFAGLGYLDAVNMDFIRDRFNKVITDGGKPIGYILKMTLTGEEVQRAERELRRIFTKYKKNFADRDITQQGIPFDREDVVHFKLYPLSDSEMGVGFIEPLYDTVFLKLEIEEALGRGLKRVGQPLLIATVKPEEEGREVSEEKVKRFSEEIMSGIHEATDVTLSDKFELEYLEPTKIAQSKEFLDYFAEIIAAGLGIPYSYLLAGKTVGSKVAEEQMNVLIAKIRFFQTNLADSLKEQVFRKLIEEAGLKEVPEIRFKLASPALLGDRARRLQAYSRAGLVVPDKTLEEWIRKEEGLPPIPTEDEEARRKRESYRLRQWHFSKGARRRGLEEEEEEDED